MNLMNPYDDGETWETDDVETPTPPWPGPIGRVFFDEGAE